ncbi:hypothetical protein [Pantoea agglomerans]|uniref:hypothetical protein n=1 Tax=Enterobacter agglomerans TaxID=549 RepID=UPI003965D635
MATLECIGMNTITSQYGLSLVPIPAVKALRIKPAKQARVSKIPDVFILSEMARPQQMSGIVKNGNRNKQPFSARNNISLGIVDVFQRVPE